MKIGLKTVAAGAGAYLIWRALGRSSKKGSYSQSVDSGPAWYSDALKHFVTNIVLVALWKTWKERAGDSPLRKINYLLS